jgi:hypothetical protein
LSQKVDNAIDRVFLTSLKKINLFWGGSALEGAVVIPHRDAVYTFCGFSGGHPCSDDKVAVELGSEYVDALCKYKDIIAEHVTENIFERHIKPVFIGKP